MGVHEEQLVRQAAQAQQVKAGTTGARKEFNYNRGNRELEAAREERACSHRMDLAPFVLGT